MNESKTDLLSLELHELEALMTELGEPKYRAKQLFTGMHKGISPESLTNISKATKAKLAEVSFYALPTVERKLVSALDGTVKYLFRLADGNCVESVIMRYEHGITICISSQVGCRMGCRFCASTIDGKVRDLAPAELLGQILAATLDLGERISNIVMMGIGEPLDNYENVIRFLHLVNHPEGLSIGYRHISLSTCGVVPGIRRLAEEGLPVTLSVSLHAPTDEARSEIMPINRAYPIRELMAACTDYFAATGRRISFEYTLIAGKNDRPEDAARLADLLRSTVGADGAPVHVNLIRANEVKETGFKGTSSASAAAFAERLNKRGLTATVRRRLGTDVNAACGQLRRARKASEEV